MLLLNVSSSVQHQNAYKGMRRGCTGHTAVLVTFQDTAIDKSYKLNNLLFFESLAAFLPQSCPCPPCTSELH